MENSHRHSTGSKLELLPKPISVAAHNRRVEVLDTIDTSYSLCVVFLLPSSAHERVRRWLRVRIWLVACIGFFTDL
jgi:hypothetical protein